MTNLESIPCRQNSFNRRNHPDYYIPTRKDFGSLLRKQNQKTIKKKNSHRTLYITLLSLLMVSALLLSFPRPFNAAKAESVPYVTQSRFVKVTKGDTIWDIALYYKNPDQNLRQYVYKIYKINNLKGFLLQENQVLILPD